MKHKVAVFGEALFDLIQLSSGDYRPFVGGSPFNVARGFARLNLDCQYVAPTSNDMLGGLIRNYAAAEGIKLPESNISTHKTSLALVYTDTAGVPDYSLYRNGVADLDITAEQLLKVVHDDIRVFHTGSLALVPENTAVLKTVINTLKQQNVTISCDVNFRKGVQQDHAAYICAILDIVKLADVVKVSDEDLRLMGFTADPMTEALRLLTFMTEQGQKDKMIALTLGEGGSYLITPACQVSARVYPVERFGDTVGAGDTFFSSLIGYLLLNAYLDIPISALRNTDLQRALNYATIAASLNVSKVGCQPPRLEEVKQAALFSKWDIGSTPEDEL